MDPQFDDYRKMLDLVAVHRTSGPLRQAVIAAGIPIVESEPWSGYFRLAQSKDGPLEPLAIWREGERLFVVWGSIVWEGDEAKIERFWPHAAWKPVPYAWYEGKTERGEEWPDAHVLKDEPPLDGVEEMIGRVETGKTVAQMRAENPSFDRDLERTFAMADAAAGRDYEGPGAGHNSGATLDELRLLADEIDEAKRGVKQYAKIQSDEQRAQSQELRSDLLKLAGQAKKRREALSRPHLDALDEIRKKWSPLVDGAQAAADTIKDAQEAWGTVKLRRQREEQERAEAERRRLEQEAAAAAEAAQAAVDAGEAPPDPVPMAPAPEPVRVAPQTTFKGASGRAAHEKPVTVISEVTDWKALFLYFVEDQDARAYVLKRAQSILKNTGQIPPGCNTDVVAKVA